MRHNQPVQLQLQSRVYFDMLEHLRKTGDRRPFEHVLGLALKEWLDTRTQRPGNRGYQWKELFLPEGTELRLRFQQAYYFAKVEADELLYEDFPVSPDAWVKSVTGQVRNAWRDIWIRRSVNDCWMRAASWRATHKAGGLLDCAERRRQHRRSTD